MTYYFSRTEKACKRKFMEIGVEEKTVEIEDEENGARKGKNGGAND